MQLRLPILTAARSLCCIALLAVPPAALWAGDQVPAPVKALPYTTEELLSPQVRDTYAGDQQREIRFPLGDVGAGNNRQAGRDLGIGKWIVK